MTNLKKLLALILAVAMVFALAACGETKAVETQPAETAEPAEEVVAEEIKTLSYATATFGQKFSPFFSTTAYDAEVVDFTQIGLLAADRGGAVINNGIEGVTVDYNGTDYFYNGAGDVEVVQNEDGTVDYFLTMRDDIVFSDGTPATIDDVIFGFYVFVDPTYDGSSTYYALPIEGMEEYRAGMESRQNLILAAGNEGYEANDYYTEDQYNTYWDAFWAAGVDFVLGIKGYLVGYGYNAEDDPVAVWAANWGYDALAEDATEADFFDAIVDSFGFDLSDDGINYEAGTVSISECIAAQLGDKASEFEAGVQTGEGAPNVAGLIKTGDYSLQVHMTEFDATAIYNMSFIIAPLHYYGDVELYDYENNSFGFVKGDLSGIKAKNTAPLGAGPYVFDGYANGVVTLKANPSFFKGEPEIDVILMNESSDADYIPGIVSEKFDVAQPSISTDKLLAIKDANSNGELVGETLTTILVDFRGYGYLGINADLVNIDDDPGSDASKALRKGFMTLFSVYRDTVINSYYGDRASVIQYPISNTSWAAPKPADEGYRIAYSVDVDGNPIYDASMSDEQKYEAAKNAAIGFFKAAGFTFDEAAGKFVDVAETYDVLIPGDGAQDHPAYGVVVAASEVCAELGITLQVNDVNVTTWNNALEANTAMMWAAAWRSTVDPDMTQVYHSSNAHGLGTNSNHYAVCDDELDALIFAGRRSPDTEERKSIYKAAMEIILDWGCELPLYQRKDCTVVSTIRVDTATLPGDITPYWGWYAEIETLSVM